MKEKVKKKKNLKGQENLSKPISATGILLKL